MPTRVEHPLQDVLARLGDLQGLGEQVAVVVHQDAPFAQRAGEGVVLLLRPAHPENAVEEQVGGVVRGQPLELQVRAVQYHLPQAADLGIDVKHRPSRSGWIRRWSCTEPAYASSLVAAASGGACRSRWELTVTGSGHGIASSGSSNAIETSSDGSCTRSI